MLWLSPQCLQLLRPEEVDSYGLTSTDVVDTAYGVLYKEARIILYRDLLDFRHAQEKA